MMCLPALEGGGGISAMIPFFLQFRLFQAISAVFVLNIDWFNLIFTNSYKFVWYILEKW